MKEPDRNYIKEAFAAAVVQERGTVEQRGELRAEIGERRDFCSKRGFHRIPTKSSRFNICDDCELWFDDNSEVNYKVDPDLL